ncbi:MAG: hypothetical protein LBH37_02045, partial [Oscillospiraceae bacterium]|nr:hypothetical protein [Oscillospiraceae bacterium]
MKYLKKTISTILTLLLLLFNSNAFASHVAFESSRSQTGQNREIILKLTLYLKDICSISAFEMEINFESSKLIYKELICDSIIKNKKNLKVLRRGNKLTIKYFSEEKDSFIENLGEFTLFSLRFICQNKDKVETSVKVKKIKCYDLNDKPIDIAPFESNFDEYTSLVFEDGKAKLGKESNEN